MPTCQRRPWTERDDDTLIRARGDRKTFGECGNILNRTAAACKVRYFELCPVDGTKGKPEELLPADDGLPPGVTTRAKALGLVVSVVRYGHSPEFWMVRDAHTGADLGNWVPHTESYRAGSTRGKSADWQEVLRAFVPFARRTSREVGI